MEIILASGSPRRKELLEKFGLKIKVITSDIEEKVLENESPKQVSMSLALQKCLDVCKKVEGESIVIAADTIVVYNGTILGKPNNREEAFNMLKLLNNNSHSVFTGISIIKANSNIKVIDYVETKVSFRYISDDKINNYLDTGEYKDKAGSYGIQGIGSVLVDSITGCYSNVVGLPVTKLDILLKKYFDLNLL